jgi:hypothetical protein
MRARKIRGTTGRWLPLAIFNANEVDNTFGEFVGQSVAGRMRRHGNGNEASPRAREPSVEALNEAECSGV